MLMMVFSNSAMARVELTAEEVESWANEVFGTAFEDKQYSGAIVTVVQDGKIVMNKGYGYADYGDKTPVLPDATGFRIGSVTKTFTATAIAQLKERGLI
jgi:CubicO group peptidase (beta-lactamase class C family)